MPGFSLENLKKVEYAWTDHPSDDIQRGGPCDSIEEWMKEYKYTPSFYKVHPLTEPVVISLEDSNGV